MLPSRILDDANTIDLYVMDMALSFEKYHNSSAKPTNELDINTLEEAVKKVK